MLDVRVPEMIDLGMAWDHDQACAVCQDRHAVYDTNLGVFLPCWVCQEDGWRLKKKRRRHR